VPAEQVPAESDEVEQFAAAPVDLLRGHQAELAQWPPDDACHGMPGVERVIWVLRHVSDPAALAD
jgi:hypothetical protein